MVRTELRHGNGILPKITDDDSAPHPSNTVRLNVSVTGRVEQLSKPGLILDRSSAYDAPGVLVKKVITAEGHRKSLTVLQSHDECQAAEVHLQGVLDEHGQVIPSGDLANWHDAKAYPKRTKKNCKNYFMAQAAEKAGLPPGAAVCPNCPFRKNCPYLAEMEKAEKADHRIMTMRRASCSLANAAKDVDAVFVIVNETHGDSLMLFAEPLDETFFMADALTSLQTIVQAAEQIGQGLAKNGREDAPFWVALQRGAEALRKHIADGKPGRPKMPRPRSRPQCWASWLFQKLTALATDPTTAEGLVTTFGAFHPERLPNGDLLRLTLAFAAGELDGLELFADQAAGTIRVVGRRRLALPDVPILVVDGTLTAGELAALTGKPVYDITDPAAERLLNISQVPKHATGAQRPTTALKTIRWFLDQHPGQSVGVLLNKMLLDPVAASLTADERKRVRLAVWYKNPPREFSQCDAILALGCPTPSRRHVRKRLLYYGEYEAAFQDGGWGKTTWQGVTEDGRTQDVTGKRYADPTWHEVFMAFTLAWLRGTLARFDAPVTVVSSLDLGAPLVPPPLPTAQARLLAVLEDELNRKHSGVSAENALISNKGAPFRAFHALTVPTARLAELSGLSVRAVQVYLSELQATGIVCRVGTRKEGGWTLPKYYPPSSGLADSTIGTT
jgi:hypothetical protein